MASYKRLRAAIKSSRKKLKPFRDHRYTAVREYVGMHYSDSGTDEKIPINLLELAINIYSRQLAARAPKVLVTMQHRELKPQAAKFGLGLNHLIEEIRLAQTIRTAVVDALFSVGIIKVGLSRYATAEIDGFTHDVGQPFADTIYLDDWVHDTTARRYEQVGFAGHMYEAPYDYVMESDWFDRKAKEGLKPYDPGQGDNDEESNADRTERLSTGDPTSEDENYRKILRLWDIWLPFENRMVTLLVDKEDTRPLAEHDWDGLEGGPFHILGFSEVPGNIMPLAPVALWMDIHTLANAVYRKLGRQAERQKTVHVVGGASSRTGKDLRDASDGDIINGQANAMSDVKTGGVDPTSFAFVIQANDLFSRLAGNLDSLGGLSPQADTATQDTMLLESASKRMADYQDRTVDFAKGVGHDLGFYLFYDPFIDYPLVQRPQGVNIEIPVTFSPEDRDGDYLDYNFEIEPYSMQHYTPGMKLNTIRQVWQQDIMPMAELGAQQGVMANLEGYLRLVAQYANLSELGDLVTFVEPMEQDGDGPIGQQPRKASVTTRNYNRTNRPGASTGGKNAAMTQALMGAGVQPAEMNAVSRPTG